MLFLISPAKTLDFSPEVRSHACTQPRHLKEAEALVAQLRGLDPAGLGRLLGVSDALADLNHRRFQAWSAPFAPPEAKAALLAYAGEQYAGLDAASLGEEDLAFAQDHLRILSGLYGLLRPLDLIRPYRLEMATRLANARGRDLQAFWRQPLMETLARDLAQGGPRPVLVNAASEEYSRALDLPALGARVITPVFQEGKGGTWRVVSFHAKRARGLLCRFALRRRLEDPEALKGFREAGYALDPQASEGDRWVFRRQA